MAWPPEIQLKTEGGVFLPWTPTRFSANEVILVLHGCLIWSLSEKGALSLPFVNHTIAALFCALSTLDGIFSFLSLVLFQPYVLVPFFRAVFQPTNPEGGVQGRPYSDARSYGAFSYLYSPSCLLLSQNVPFALWAPELSLAGLMPLPS